ncbi:MAG: PRD domain-containing protein [Lachnospiraceae bacterium]|nr:PRD domain-containing protein [Lachnospiraceae bacterium]
MKIHKVLNNNLVSVIDADGREMLIMGLGLGFHAKSGSEVDVKKITKIFRMDTEVEVAQLKKLFLEVESKAIETSVAIIEYAREVLKVKLNKNVYITLTDHINFAIERFEKGIAFKDMLYFETKKLYPKEFSIGVHALDMIKERLNVELPKDEAGSIALHIVNAELDGNMNRTMETTKITEQALDIVRFTFHITFDENSLNYGRFVTHLLYFAKRVQEGKLLDEGRDCMYDTMKMAYPKQFNCAEKIAEAIGKRYGVKIPEEEITFLTVHIVRVTKREDSERNVETIETEERIV